MDSEDLISCPYCNAQNDLDCTERDWEIEFLSETSYFRCDSCKRRVYEGQGEDEYITELEAGCREVLAQLEQWVFTLGKKDDYDAMKMALTERFGRPPGEGDIVWGLMNESLKRTVSNEFEEKSLRELMAKFKAWESKARKRAKG